MTNRFEIEDQAREEYRELDNAEFAVDLQNRLRHWSRTGVWPGLPERELEELPL